MSKKPMICPVCEEGHLHEDHFAGDFKHGDKLVHVDDLECYRCNTCGADPVMEDQIRHNHLKVADAKRHVDGLLSGANALREECGMKAVAEDEYEVEWHHVQK